jgi:hypothetical protein
MRAAFVFKAGGGASPQCYLRNIRTGQGGIKYYCGGSSFGFYVEHFIMESDGSTTPPAFWAQGLSAFGTGNLLDIQTADGASQEDGSMFPIVLEGDSFLSPSQILVTNGSSASIVGPCTIICGGNDNNPANPVIPLVKNQVGLLQGKIWGQYDGGHFSNAWSTQRYRNIYPSHTSSDGLSGPLHPHPLGPTSNCVWTETGATGVNGVDAPVEDRWGTDSAFKVESNDGANVASAQILSARFPVEEGDILTIGFWAKIVDGITSFNPASYGAYDNTGMSIKPIGSGITDSGDVYSAYAGDSNYWQWCSGALEIIETVGHVAQDTSVNVRVFGSQTKPATYCGVTLNHLHVEDTSLNEGASYKAMGGPTVQSPVGSVSTLPNQLAIVGKLGVGNTVAATTPGTVTRKMEIFDADGISLGFVALYDVIT